MPRARRSASLREVKVNSATKNDAPAVMPPIKKEPLINMDVQDSSGSSKRKRSEKSVTLVDSIEVKTEPVNKKSRYTDKSNEEKKMAIDESNTSSKKLVVQDTEKKKTVPELLTPRRSSRGLIPNKKFQDNEIEDKKIKVKNTENLIKTTAKIKEKITVQSRVDTEPLKQTIPPTANLQTKAPVKNSSSESTIKPVVDSQIKATDKETSLPSKPVLIPKPSLNNANVKEQSKDKPTTYNRVSLFKNKYEYTETVVPVVQFKNPAVTNIMKNEYLSDTSGSQSVDSQKIAKYGPGSQNIVRSSSTIHKIHSVDKERNTTAYIVYPSKTTPPISAQSAVQSSDNQVIEVESIVTIESDSVSHTSTNSGYTTSTTKAAQEQEKEGTGTLIKESLALLDPTDQEDNVEYVDEEGRKGDEIEDIDTQTVVKSTCMLLSDTSPSHRPGKIVRGVDERTICVNVNAPEDDDTDAVSLRNVVLKLPDSCTPMNFSSNTNKSLNVSPRKHPPVEVIVPKKKPEYLKVTSKGEVIMSEGSPQSTITIESMPTSEATGGESEDTHAKDGQNQIGLKYCNVQEIKVEPREETIESGIVQSHPAGFITTSTHDNVYKTIHNKSSIGRENQKTQTEELILVELPDGVQVIRKDLNERHSESDGADEDGKFQCKLCSYATHKKANWYKHKTKHIALRNHKCTQCSYRAATSSNLKRHLAIHSDTREFQCAICMLNFRQKIHLERHLKYKHQEKKVSCPICPYLCANENPDLRIHIRRKHMPVDSLSAHMCEECGLVTVSKKDLKQHQKFHKKGPELKFFCESCSFVTDCESRLRRHMFIHTKEKPYQCGLCEYRGSQKEHVLRHMKSQHQVEIERTNRKQNLQPAPTESDPPQEVVISDSSEKADYSSEEKIFACNHCTMKFSKLINLYKHLHAQHKGVMPNSEEEFTCVVCDFRTNNKKNLLVHMRKHNAQDQSPPSHVYSCVLCRYMNPRRRNLFQHMKKKHHIEIMLKQDGTANCYMADATTTRVEVQEQSHSASGEVEIVTESLGINNIISLDEIAMVVSNPLSNTVSTVPVTVTSNTVTDSNTSNVDEHEAAEAIEGLQALAEQAGLVETIVDNVIEEPVQDINIEDQQELLIDESDLQTKAEEVTEQSGQSIQLTPDQLLNLTSGDYVEINGEMYKVEISSEEKNAAKDIQDMTE